MKLLLSLALLSGSIGLAQHTVYKSGGTKIDAGQIDVNVSGKRVNFKANGKEASLKFAEIDSISVGGKVLKRFDIGKKTKLYYVLATQGNRVLGVYSTKRNRDRGGFATVVTLYDVVVIENGKILKQINFTESRTESEAERREAFFGVVSDFFADCTPLRNKVDLFRSENDPTNIMFLKILNDPDRIFCK